VFLPKLMFQFYVNQWRCQIISIFEPPPLDDYEVCIGVFCSEVAPNGLPFSANTCFFNTFWMLERWVGFGLVWVGTQYEVSTSRRRLF
jgi:hypothetical protein